jgi:hypothetical protein
VITAITIILRLLGIDDKFKTLIAYGLLFASIAGGLWYVRYLGVVAERSRQELIISAMEAESLRVKLDAERRNAATQTQALEAAQHAASITAAVAEKRLLLIDDLAAQLTAMKIEEDKPDAQNPNIIIRTRNLCVLPDGYRERLLTIAPRHRAKAIQRR